MKYKIGDKVKIKTWDKLVEKYGTNNDGYVVFPNNRYTEADYGYYGKVLKITSIFKDAYFDEERYDTGFYEEEIEGLADERSCENCTYEKISDSLDPCFPCENGEKFRAKDNINHPSYYNNSGMECIDEMIAVFGVEAVRNFCLCNVWKYRHRALHKNGEEDLKKADWYMKKFVELGEEETK